MKKSAKKIAAAVMAAMAVCVGSVGAFALDESISTALSTGFTSVSTDAITVIALIVPIGLAITGAVFVIKRALAWFKSMAKG